MASTTTHQTGPVCFWKHVDAQGSTASNDYKCAGIYQEPAQSAFALSLLQHELLVHRGATLTVEKTKRDIVIVAGWGGGVSRSTIQFKIPESGQISKGDELPQIRSKSNRFLVFPTTPIQLNLQIQMLQEATD